MTSDCLTRLSAPPTLVARHLTEVWLAEVIIGDNESFESALKRFTKRVQQDGILAEARRREHYEKPSVRRKKKAAAKRRKSRKAAT
jgi:small subunit ribosomal protein S21